MTRDISSFSRTYRRLRGSALGVTLLLALSCGGPPTGSVILVVVDTLRADHLGLYGYARPTSPNLDAWAKDGRVFDHAYAPSPWTLPSFASIYTGHWPLIHQGGRFVRLDAGNFDTLAPVEYLPALAEILQTEGFQTMAVVNNAYLAPSFGMARGFDVYDFDPAAGSNPHRSAASTIQRAFELVDAAAGQPFFLVIHLFEPHDPYSAPPPFRGSFTAAVAGSNFTLPITDLQGLRVEELSAEDQAFITAAYDEDIAYTDQQLGVLRDGLADRGLLEDSLVIFTADHGEELFEHGGFEHAHALWQELLHVPLILWGAGVNPGRDATPVSLVDIAPTVLDWLDLVSPVPFDGLSLLPTVSASVQVPDRPLYAESVPRSTPQSAVIRWPHKLVIDHASGRLRRFDLAQDPHERHILAGNSRALVADFCRHQLRARDSEQAPATPSQEVTERLRSLGYLRGPATTTSYLEDRQYPCYSDKGSGANINVRWSDSVDAALRTTLEQSLGLVRAEHLVETTWRYRLPDPSPDRLRAIVTHEMVEDTHGFDRATLELDAR